MNETQLTLDQLARKVDAFRSATYLEKPIHAGEIAGLMLDALRKLNRRLEALERKNNV